jgi:hypothetical protein
MGMRQFLKWSWAIAALLMIAASPQAYAVCRPGSSSTMLDVSHDLRPLGIASQNMKPGTPGFDVTNLLNDAITYAIHHGCTKITGEAGEYYFRTSYEVNGTNENYYIYLNRAKNLSIDFPGSTFIFKQPAFPAFRIDNCEGCAITGLAIDYSILPFTQLSVIGIDQAKQQVIVKPMPGYPDVDQLHKVQGAYATEFVAFDIRQTAIQYAISGAKVTLPSSQADRILFGSLASAFQPGDLLIVSARGGGPAIYAVNNAGITVKDVAIYASAGPAIEVKNSSGVTIEQVVIEPKPGTTRRIGVVAGGIELNNLLGNNAVRQCTIIRALDDSIAGYVNPSAYSDSNLNVVLIGNTIKNSFLARGIAFKSVTGVHITENTILGTQQAGILLVGQNEGSEGEPVRDAQITHNTLTSTNIGPSGVGPDMLGAIEVMYYGNNAAVNTPVNSRVYVNNNTINTTLRTGIWIGNVDQGAVKENVVWDYGLSGGSLGSDDHIPNGLKQCAPQLFRQETVGWYNQNFSGVVAAPQNCLAN